MGGTPIIGDWGFGIRCPIGTLFKILRAEDLGDFGVLLDAPQLS